MTLIAAIECASEPANPGGYSTPLLRKGWQYALDEYEKAKRVGATGLLTHLPGSRLVIGREMSMYASLVWRSHPDAANLIDGQADFINEFRKAWPNDSLAAYMGKASAWFCELDNETAWHMARVAMAPWPWFDGIDIVFDEAGRVPSDSVYGYVIERTIEVVTKRGGSVKVEPASQPWSVTAGLESVQHEDHWRRYHSKHEPAGRWLTGHEAKVVTSPWMREDNTPDVAGFVADCDRRGDTAIVNVGWIERLFEGAK